MRQNVIKKLMNNNDKESLLPKFIGEKLSLNLYRLMSISNINPSQLHKNTNIPKSTLSRMLTNKEVNPTISTLIPIANFFSVTINQLLGIDPLPNESSIGAYAEKRNNWTEVPIIDWELATTWSTKNIETKKSSAISTDIEISAGSFALKINDEDLEGFLQGSILIIDPKINPVSRDYIIVHKKGQKSASFKQLLLHEGEKYLKPLNKEFKTTEFDNTYKLIGVMVQVRMDWKKC